MLHTPGRAQHHGCSPELPAGSLGRISHCPVLVALVLGTGGVNSLWSSLDMSILLGGNNATHVCSEDISGQPGTDISDCVGGGVQKTHDARHL